MDYQCITLERDSAVAVLTLNRPERLNAISQPMLTELFHACDAVEADSAVRALVLTGSGKAFSAGFDLQDQAATPPQGRAAWEPVLRRDFDGVMRFWNMTKPTVAAVNGPALAGGCEMAIACDITIAAATATFGEPELKFGAGIVVMLLPWLVPAKKAKEVIMLGLDRISAEEAREMGLVNRVVPQGQVMAEAMAIAHHLAVVDPMVMQKTKRALNESLDIAGMAKALENALQIDLEIEGEGSADKRAFLEALRVGGLRGALAWRDQRFAAQG